MWRKSVAVLDVRSSEISIVIGERGVNNTFVFKASKTEPYDGYEQGAFYDEEKLSDAVFRALTSVEQVCGKRIRDLYIGVPGMFCKIVPQSRDISFPQKRRIGKKELDALFESGNESMEGYRLIRATSVIYVTADNRRYVDPEGLTTSSLSGVLSYCYADNYFIGVMEKIFSEMKIVLHYLPMELAMASYLITPEVRGEYALFLDVGFLSTTLCVLLGNGVLAQQTYWVGKGQIAARLMDAFELPYEAALALLSKANLFAKSNAGSMEFVFRGDSYEIDTDKLVDTVKEGLDEICEEIGTFLEDCSGKELDNKPLYVSGEGLSDIRGSLEHISKRINRVCEMLSPDLPYYNKPSMSSRISLIDMAYEDHRKSGILYRLLNGFGG